MKLLSVFLLFISSASFADTTSVVLKIKFKSGDINIQPEESYIVDNLYSLVTYFPASRIYIIGHTDSSGAEDINLELSKARARTVYNKMTQKGVDVNKVIVKGMGENAPIGDNRTVEGRNQNRRVVVTFTRLNNTEVEELKQKLKINKGLELLQNENQQVLSFINTNEKEYADSIKKSDFIKEENSHPEEKTVKETLGKEEFKFRYRAITGAYYNVLNAEDRDNSNADAEWVSKLNVPIGGEVQFKVSSLWIGARIMAHIQDYEIEQDPGYTWDEDNPLLIRGAIVTDYEKENWGFGLGLDFSEEPFIYERGGNVTLDKDLLMGLTLSGQYVLLKQSRWSSRVGLKLSYPLVALSTDIESEGQLGYVFSVDLRQERALGQHSVSAQLYYGQRNFSNQQNDQVEQILGVSISVDSLGWL